MCHCSPAPPECPPGIYDTICFGHGAEALLVVTVGVIVLALGVEMIAQRYTNTNT